MRLRSANIVDRSARRTDSDVAETIGEGWAVGSKGMGAFKDSMLLKKKYINPHTLPSVNEPNTVVDFLLFIGQRVFRLPAWLQRLVHGFDLMLRNTLESFLVWFLAWKLEQIFEGV